MKYAKSGTFTTKHFGIDETLTEIDDVVTVAMDCIKNGDLKLAQTNLATIEDYIEHIRPKVKVAMKYVPTNVQEKEFL